MLAEPCVARASRSDGPRFSISVSLKPARPIMVTVCWAGAGWGAAVAAGWSSAGEPAVQSVRPAVDRLALLRRPQHIRSARHTPEACAAPAASGTMRCGPWAVPFTPRFGATLGAWLPETSPGRPQPGVRPTPPDRSVRVPRTAHVGRRLAGPASPVLVSPYHSAARDPARHRRPILASCSPESAFDGFPLAHLYAVAARPGCADACSYLLERPNYSTRWRATRTAHFW